MGGLRLLAELPEPGPILDEIRKLIPSYTGHPKGANKRGQATLSGKAGGPGE